MERAICKYRVATRVGIERVHNRDPLFFPRVLPYESIKRGRSEEESRGRIDEYGFSNKTRGDRRRVTRRLSRFHVAFYRRFNVDPFFPPPQVPLTTPRKKDDPSNRSPLFSFPGERNSGGRRMVQMVGMVGVRHRLHAHQEKIL